MAREVTGLVGLAPSLLAVALSPPCSHRPWQRRFCVRAGRGHGCPCAPCPLPQPGTSPVLPLPLAWQQGPPLDKPWCEGFPGQAAPVQGWELQLLQLWF